MTPVPIRAALLSALLAGVATAPVEAQTYASTFDSDASFLSWAADNDWVKHFGANMKWGNNALGGDWEWALVDGSDRPLVQDDMAWDGLTYEFSFIYDPFEAALGLAGSGMVADVGGRGVTHILARASMYEDNDWTGFDWFDISLSTGESIFNSSLQADSDAEYWAIEDTRLADGFVATGAVTLGGDAGRTALSRPMAQFKVGTARVSVPEPENWLLMATALVMLGIVSLRRRRIERA